jgi:aryl-alcohol dehydrogenase-like predicted oxidoreductase
MGEGIRASQIGRKNIFVRQPQDPVHGHQPHQLQITSKLWNTHYKPEDVEKALDITLRNLQTHYLDL